MWDQPYPDAGTIYGDLICPRCSHVGLVVMAPDAPEPKLEDIYRGDVLIYPSIRVSCPACGLDGDWPMGNVDSDEDDADWEE